MRQLKAVKSATKNKSTVLEFVDREQLQEIFSATRTTIENMVEDTENRAYKRFFSIKRAGGKIEKNGNIVPFKNEELIVNIVSDRYQLAQHEAVIGDVMNVLDNAGLKFSIPKLYVDQRQGKNRIYANLVFDEVKVDVDGSRISPTIDVFNSTDGGLPAGILFGAYRFKCENGMVIGVDYGIKKVIHTPSILEKWNFSEMYSKVLENFDELALNIEKMQGIPFKNEMLEDLSKMGFPSMFIKHYDEIVEKYMLNNREQVKKDSLWSLYSTATNFISNHMMLKDIGSSVNKQNILNDFLAKELEKNIA
jgi:hypothetical protein